jgi:hypothetical protein
MNSKWLLMPVFAYLIFLSGMCFIGLGKFASLVLADGWWVLTKDFASLLASLSTALGLPLAIWLYFKQRERDHDERIVQQLRELMEELTSVLAPEMLLVNQVVINSLLYRINSKRMEVDERNRKEFDTSLITHINQLFKNIQPCNVISDYSEIGAEYLISNVELNDLHDEIQKAVLWLATCIVNSKSYKIIEIGTFKHVNLDKGFSAELLSQLIFIAQPICIGNYTNSVKDTSWNSEKLNSLFFILPFTVAAYIYLAYSDTGKNLIIDLHGER